MSRSQRTNNSNNINLSGCKAARRALNLDMTAVKILEGMGWANINVFTGNVIFFSKTTPREAEVQQISFPYSIPYFAACSMNYNRRVSCSWVQSAYLSTLCLLLKWKSILHPTILIASQPLSSWLSCAG